MLLALVGAGNRFVALDASSYGKGGDADIFIKSVLGKSIPGGTVEFPKHRLLPRMTTVLLCDCRCQGTQVNKYTDKAFYCGIVKVRCTKVIFYHSQTKWTYENAIHILKLVFQSIFHHSQTQRTYQNATTD